MLALPQEKFLQRQKPSRQIIIPFLPDEKSNNYYRHSMQQTLHCTIRCHIRAKTFFLPKNNNWKTTRSITTVWTASWREMYKKAVVDGLHCGGQREL